MADEQGASQSTTIPYPLTKMNFFVKVGEKSGTAAFTEVTGVEASIDVIEFRAGNAGSLSPQKIPGLVKHGNVTLKYGYIAGNEIRNWIIESISSQRSSSWARLDITIELIDITTEGVGPHDSLGSGKTWVLKNAFVAKYSGADLDAKSSDVAVESIEIAYEELLVAN